MPHVTIEYSGNLADHHDLDALVAAVHRAALAHPGVAPDALRTRAVCCAAYRIADGHALNAFVAIHVRLAPGRKKDEKRRLIEGVLAAAEHHAASEGGPLAIAWSIELTELDPEFRINHNRVRARMQEETA